MRTEEEEIAFRRGRLLALRQVAEQAIGVVVQQTRTARACEDKVPPWPELGLMLALLAEAEKD